MGKIQNLQEIFLNQARCSKMPVLLFLVNGFQLRGVVTGFDNFVVVLDTDGKQQLIYKHAISTIVPSRVIPLNVQEDETARP
ncbi:MAG: RNA chaperone Hfq [Clostridiales bacterium]|nr:RNA chaperone Hfq [Clostridiales bacterium]